MIEGDWLHRLHFIQRYSNLFYLARFCRTVAPSRGIGLSPNTLYLVRSISNVATSRGTGTVGYIIKRSTFAYTGWHNHVRIPL
jgi:hypothetical protein